MGDPFSLLPTVQHTSENSLYEHGEAESPEDTTQGHTFPMGHPGTLLKKEIIHDAC